MKKTFLTLAAMSALSSVALFAKEDPSKNAENEKQEIATVNPEDIPKISKSFGNIVGQNLLSLGLDFDMQEVIHGIQDALNGVEPPLSESECFQAISVIQENSFKKESEKNLADAETFLSKNKSRPGLVELESGKLQYVQLQKGEGQAVEAHHTPVIRYKGTFLDGKLFGESQSEEAISLEETIPGFRQALIGMKEGEKREVFIHPSLGYGVTGYLPPNSLLTFELEVVKANAPVQKEDNHTAAQLDMGCHHEEIASIDDIEKSVK